MKKFNLYFLFLFLFIAGSIFILSEQDGVKSGNLSMQVETVIRNHTESETVIQGTQGYEAVHFLGIEVRKWAHICLYMLLGVCGYGMLTMKWGNYKKRILYGFTICILYGATDEFHQMFVIGREGKITDLFYDGTGILIGIGAIRVFEIIKNRRVRGKRS